MSPRSGCEHGTSGWIRPNAEIRNRRRLTGLAAHVDDRVAALVSQDVGGRGFEMYLIADATMFLYATSN